MTKWIVDDSNNGDFRTIAEAIAAADKGDEIIVTGGDDNIHLFFGVETLGFTDGRKHRLQC